MSFVPGRPGARAERAARTTQLAARLGSGIAAVCGVGLVLSLLLPWSGRGLVCVSAPCPGSTSSGWEALQGGALPYAAAGVLGLSLAIPRISARLATVVSGAGLAAGGLAVAAASSSPRYPFLGPLVALATSLGIGGGAMLAGVGDRFFERVAARWPAVFVLAAPLVLVASLFLPWFETLGGSRGFVGFGVLMKAATGWEALRVADVLIAMTAFALLAGAVAAAVLAWRAIYLALALGGWFAAALVVYTVAMTSRVFLLDLGAPARTELTLSFAAGPIVALAACAVLALAALVAAGRPARAAH